jgi:hypothetical protein
VVVVATATAVVDATVAANENTQIVPHDYIILSFDIEYILYF